jgi:transcriptional regulator with XRE-family HTH domain
MTANDRIRARATARARRILADFSIEIKNGRLEAELSQEELGRRAGMSGDKVWQVEHQRLRSLSIHDACLLGAVIGLDLSCRTYPSGSPVRDAAQAKRLARLLGHIGKPLVFVTDAPLPNREGIRERRAWDAVISGAGKRTAVELESRLTDIQAVTRRHNDKRRDDPVDHFLLVVANTRHNRRTMSEFAPLLAHLPRLRTATVIRLFALGKHPPTGWILF